MERRAYGSFSAGIYGKRQWGVYDKPRQFSIAVNKMADVIKHEDKVPARTNLSGIQSSLSEGIRVSV